MDTIVCSICKSNLETCNYENISAINTGSAFTQRYVHMQVLHILKSQRQFTISSNKEQNVSTFPMFVKHLYSVYYKLLTKHETVEMNRKRKNTSKTLRCIYV